MSYPSFFFFNIELQYTGIYRLKRDCQNITSKPLKLHCDRKSLYVRSLTFYLKKEKRQDFFYCWLRTDNSQAKIRINRFFSEIPASCFKTSPQRYENSCVIGDYPNRFEKDHCLEGQNFFLLNI